jgi:rhodanese-related sulfurtransferase
MRNKEVPGFMVRYIRRGAEVSTGIIPLSKKCIIAAISLRGILAISLIFWVCLFASYFFLPALPKKTPLPSTNEKSTFEKTEERVDQAVEDSSEENHARLYVSMESVLSMLKRKQDILLVDVRDKEAFEKFRLPGSIRVSLHALKTKAFLKGSAVVLVSEGYPSGVLERTCRELRAVGFAQLSILNGGLRHWQQKNGPIEGEAFAASEVSRISPIDFFSQKDSAEWLVITVSNPDFGAGRSQALIPGARHLPWEGNPSKFTSALKAIVCGRAKSPLLSILVCDASGTQYEGIERAVQQAEIGKVFYLNGGLEAYQAFLEQQALLRQPGTEEVKRCATCS